MPTPKTPKQTTHNGRTEIGGLKIVTWRTSTRPSNTVPGAVHTVTRYTVRCKCADFKGETVRNTVFLGDSDGNICEECGREYSLWGQELLPYDPSADDAHPWITGDYNDEELGGW